MLRTIKLGEADRIVTLLTAGRGKVRAVAKGVRKTKSRFGSRLEPMVHVSLLLYEGRELDIVTQAETIETSGRSGRTSTGCRRRSRCWRRATRWPRRDTPTPGCTRCCWAALRALAAHDAPLLVPAFFLKLLAVGGLPPLCSTRAWCAGRSDDLVRVRPGARGRAVRGRAPGRRRVAAVGRRPGPGPAGPRRRPGDRPEHAPGPATSRSPASPPAPSNTTSNAACARSASSTAA